ncbi:hypothetical protein [Rhizobium sp. BK602]|uniref:hypothetical protein n=1 Tax=Rhizobium sp. BK602 TaxID=2586986 RepID=UPI0017B43092|nr:hypothetical protein [Rhizobium sp. BK602]MBB3610877.1 hypothetical protein [Rhizobium sp. BK602]
MSAFNPIRERETMDGAVEYVLRTEFDPTKPMGNFAANNIARVIAAWLVLYNKEIEPAIHRANRWLDQVLDAGGEKFGPDPNAHLAKLNWARAIGTWLEDGCGDETHWDNARVFEEARWRFPGRPWPRNEVVNYGLDDYMAFACQNFEEPETVEAGIDMYEHWLGNKPLSLKKLLKPRDLGYAICLHYARQQFEEEELFEAGRRMLQANLEGTWLGSGQYMRAATWLKIVYWDRNQTLTPLETILKAYDNMPNVPRPNFI